MSIIIRGNICICKQYKLGIITHKHKNIYYDIGFDGSKWQSTNPRFIADSINDFIQFNIKDWFSLKLIKK